MEGEMPPNPLEPESPNPPEPGSPNPSEPESPNPSEPEIPSDEWLVPGYDGRRAVKEAEEKPGQRYVEGPVEETIEGLMEETMECVICHESNGGTCGDSGGRHGPHIFQRKAGFPCQDPQSGLPLLSGNRGPDYRRYICGSGRADICHHGMACPSKLLQGDHGIGFLGPVLWFQPVGRENP